MIFRKWFLYPQLSQLTMAIKLACKEYGFECDFVIQGEGGQKMVAQLRSHFDEEHGIDYDSEFLIQMVINKGHSRESITKA